MSDSESVSQTERATDPLSEAGRGAVAALIRVAELYDPSVAHRGALRAIVASRVSEKLTAPPTQRLLTIAASSLADVDLAVSRPEVPEAAREAERAELGAAIVARLPGLDRVGEVLSHQGERWDGTGVPDQLVGDEIPLGSRIVAAVDNLVGNPAAGLLPSWGPSLARLEARSGTEFDPDVVAALAALDLESIDTPLVPSAAILDLLERALPDEHPLDDPDAVTSIARAVASAARVDDLLELFASTALRTLDSRSVAILRLTGTTLEEWPIAQAVDGRDPTIDGSRLDELAEFSTQAELRAGVPLLRPDTSGSSPVDERLRIAGVGSEVTVPIMLGTEAWGVITAARGLNDRSFDTHDLSILRHVAHRISQALADNLRWVEIERMALRDQLTGLSNRHVLYTVLDEIFERDPVDRQDCALIMCDVDGLKQVNDTDGHQAGDRLLIDAARALEGAVRDPERTTICRIGGDEFCLIIDGGALLTAHEISDTIERLFERSAASGSTRSISCGIAFASLDIETRSQLLRAADENQYQTKRARKAARGEHVPAEPRARGDRRAIRD